MLSAQCGSDIMLDDEPLELLPPWVQRVPGRRVIFCVSRYLVAPTE